MLRLHQSDKTEGMMPTAASRDRFRSTLPTLPLRLVAHPADGRAAETVASPQLSRRHFIATAPAADEVSSSSLGALWPV